MTVVHTYFYIVVDTQRGCHTLKLVFLIQTDWILYEVRINIQRLFR